MARGRFCSYGHPFTRELLLKDGRRRCATCCRIDQERKRLKDGLWGVYPEMLSKPSRKARNHALVRANQPPIQRQVTVEPKPKREPKQRGPAQSNPGLRFLDARPAKQKPKTAQTDYRFCSCDRPNIMGDSCLKCGKRPKR